MTDCSLDIPGITVRDIQRNLAPAVLYQEAIHREADTVISASGALIALFAIYLGSRSTSKQI